MAEGQTVRKNTAQKHLMGSHARQMGMSKRTGSSKIGHSKKAGKVMGRGSAHGR